MRHIRVFITIAALIASSPFAMAVNPSEMLKDPALEARAREISSGLRCLVCQNQSIDISDADLAKDLRVIVRERLTAGDSDAQVFDYVVARYGEFVLLRPRFSTETLILWGAPLAFILLGGLVLILKSRRPSLASEPTALSVQERQQLAEIIDKNTAD